MIKLFSSRPHIKPYQAFILTAVAVLAIFLLRTLNTTHLELYDAFQKWVYANMITHGYFKIPKYSESTQHYMRWGVNLPTAFGIWLFGFSLRLYFAVPILTFSIFFVLFLRRSLKEMALPLVLLMGVLIYVDPTMVRISTQLHTRIFGTLYILLCILCLELRNQRLGTCLAAIFLVCAYGAKETYGLFFGPAIGLYILFHRPRQQVILFGSIIIILLGIETLIINELVRKTSWGKPEVLLEGNHSKIMVNAKKHKHITLEEMIINPWTKYSTPHQFFAPLAFFYSLACISISHWRQRLSTFQLLIHGCLVSYFLGSIFSFMKLDPYVPLQPPRTTYYAPVFPFIYFSNALLAQHGLFYIARKLNQPKIIRTAFVSITILAVALAAGFAAQKEIIHVKRSSRYLMYKVRYGKAFWNMDEDLQRAAKHIEQGATLVRRRGEHHRKAPTMVFSMRHANPALWSRKKYWWTKNRKYYSRRGLSKNERKECIYLPKARQWILHMPTERNYATCGTYKKKKRSNNQSIKSK
jgi:hypothetical protein